MIWSAVFVHLNGLAFSFQNLIHCSRAQVNSSIEQKTPRSSRRRCSSANHRWINRPWGKFAVKSDLSGLG